MLSFSETALSQIKITLNENQVQCYSELVKLGIVAKVETQNQTVKRMVEELDLDAFGEQKTIRISKEQIRIRVELAGVERGRVEFEGPNDVSVTFKSQLSIRTEFQSAIGQRIANGFSIPQEDLEVVVDPKFDFRIIEAWGFHSVQITQNFTAELPVGRQSIAVSVRNTAGNVRAVQVPVSIAVVRELIVAKQGLSQKQVITAEHIERVRRPVTNRNLRFASFEQVVGSQAQTDIRQYDVIKTNSIREVSRAQRTLVKRNSRVNIIARRGRLSVVLKNALALESGNLGDKIALKNPKTNERVIGTVVDSTTVEIKY